MRFWIVKHPGEDNTMAIDDASLRSIDLPSWPVDVDFVNWTGRSGEIRYWTQPGITVPFTDPTPYIPYINNFLTAALSVVPPINLDQAKKVKCDLVDVLYDVKRQLPISYLNRVWDAGDEPVQAMMQTLALAAYDPQLAAPPIDMTMRQMAELVHSVARRRSTLCSTRLSKRQSIDACATVEEVTPFDVLSGW